MFSTRTTVSLSRPEAVIPPLTEHLIDHGGVAVEGGLTIMGAALDIAVEDRTARFAITAPDLETLYHVRLAVAAHVAEFSAPEVPEILWAGDGADLSRPMDFRLLRVAGVRDVTPHMRRLTVQGHGLERFDTTERLHAKLVLPHPEGETHWPELDASGRVRWQDPRPPIRKYTIRSVDAARGEMEIDFVMHEDAGPGSDFAARAQVGMEFGLFGPGGGGLREADWYLLAGDETALPAIARMLEVLPDTARGHAFIAVASDEDRQPLRVPDGMVLTWLPAGGLTEAACAVPVPAEGARYFWFGAEHAETMAVREHVRQRTDLRTGEHLVVSYWRAGEAAD